MKIIYKNIADYLKSKSIDVVSDLDSKFKLNGISSITNAKTNFLTFYNDSKFSKILINTQASGCLIKASDVHLLPKTCIPIIVADPYKAFAHITNFFFPIESSKNFISKNAVIHESLIRDDNVEIKNFVVIKENTILGKNCIISDNCTIGPNVTIGNNTFISSNCSISNTIMGNFCYIKSGCRIGERGFGFISTDKTEIRHIGNVVINDNVHIGNNTSIDRATLDSTILGKNVRIDNLVQIAHNVIIGDNTIIAAQCGIAGSTTVGHNCVFGGQVGVSGHISIGNNVIVAGKSGVTKNIDNNSTIAGFPAINIKEWKKMIIKQYKKRKK